MKDTSQICLVKIPVTQAAIAVLFAFVLYVPAGGEPNPAAPALDSSTESHSTIHPQPTPGTAEWVSSVPVFDEPLIPVGLPTSAENDALAAMLQRARSEGVDAYQRAIQEFVAQHPQSPWKPALLLHLGVAWQKAGRFSRALDAWEEAWSQVAERMDGREKLLADRILGELAQLASWAGQHERLEPILAAVKDRALAGKASEAVPLAHRSAAVARTHPQDVQLCGPNALGALLSDPKAVSRLHALANGRATSKGFSLTMLQTLAMESGLNYRMAYRQPGACIPLRSVLHWRLNHFGTVLDQRDGEYLIADMAYGYLYHRPLWIKAEALEEEVSGYFLVPDGTLYPGWRAVEATEGNGVWGSGITFGFNTGDFTPNDLKPCDNTTGKGLAQPSIHLMLVSLNIVDTPIGYDPPYGPSIQFTATYNQRDFTSLAQPQYSNLGLKWTFNWFTYLDDGGPAANAPAVVTRYVSGGGIRKSTLSGVADIYNPDEEGNVITRIAQSQYEFAMPNGAKYVFAKRQTMGGTTKLFLSEMRDTVGNAVQVLYKQPTGDDRIDRIRDAAGREMIFHYDLATDSRKITSVVDPFGRTATFEYDSMSRLTKITDVGGISSQFVYLDPGDFISRLITPYGVTEFQSIEGEFLPCVPAQDLFRQLIITDPTGARESAIFRHFTGNCTTPIPSLEPEVPTLDPDGAEEFSLVNLFLNFRNTFYWDKKAMEAAPFDYTKARIYHWLHENATAGPNPITAGMLESMKAPLESRVWFRYPNQGVSPTYKADMGVRSPRLVARVVEGPDGNAATQAVKIAYNSLGNVTKIKDPIGRTTEFEYHPSGVDVHYIRNTTDGGNELLAEFPEYQKHLPLRTIDAARQTTQLVWDGNNGDITKGQLTQITNPKQEILNISYFPDTDPAAAYIQTLSRLWSGGAKNTSFTYDDYKRIRTATDSEGYTLTYDYDLFDRVTRVTYPDTTFESYRYDRFDLVLFLDRRGHRTLLSYDGLGRMTSAKDPLGRVTQYGYCGCGELTSITDALQHTTTWTLDLESRVKEKTYHDGKKWILNYQSRSGRLASVTDAKNQTKNYSYYLDDTLREITYTGAANFTPKALLTYDPKYLRIATMTDSSGISSPFEPGVDYTGVHTFSYYPITGNPDLGAGQLMTIDGPLEHDTYKFDYDELGRRIRMQNTFTDAAYSNKVERGFDDLGRVASITNVLGTFGYTYFGDIYRTHTVQFPVPTQLSTVLTYEGNALDKRLKVICHGDETGVQSIFDYTYDKEGQITNWIQYARDGSYSKVLEIEYDLADQLRNVRSRTYANPPGPILKTFSYGYDAAGNRTHEAIEPASGPVSVQAFTANDVNQFTGRNPGGPVRFEGTVNEPAAVKVAGQDAFFRQGRFVKDTALSPGVQNVQVQATDFGAGSGNTTVNTYQVTVTGGSAQTYDYDANGNLTKPGGGLNYEWDAEDRLVAVTRTVGGTVETLERFMYDGFGRMVATASKRFVWCGSEMCEERESTGLIVTKRFHGQGVAVGWVTAAQKYYYLRDHLGSIRDVVDETGAVQARYDYDPYGRRTRVAGDLDTDFGFTGHYWNAPSGLWLALFRAYDANLGRWLNRDPIEEAGGLNVYGYVGNDPFNWVDPDGAQSTSPIRAAAPFREPPPRVWPRGTMPDSVRMETLRRLERQGTWGRITGISAAPTPGRVSPTAVQAVKPPPPPPCSLINESRGGTYYLVDPITGQVMRSGRTIDLVRRESEHRRNPETESFKFEIDFRTDSYFQQRGREQIIHDIYRPPLNRINPISPNNPQRQQYLDSVK